MSIELLHRKQTHFVLWRPAYVDPTPALYIGAIGEDMNALSRFSQFREYPLQQSASAPGVWELEAQSCGLVDGQVYFYWFKVRDSNPYSAARRILYCTDPLAYTIDRRFLAPAPVEPDGDKSDDPASVILYRNGQLIPCDPSGQVIDWSGDPPLNTLPANNRLVMYELPTRWTRSQIDDKREVGTGTFRDALALVRAGAIAPDFPTVAALKPGAAHLAELGINALELLPPADSDDDYNWGYGTANYFAADFNLGYPHVQSAPTASTDLATLIKVCHQHGIRFFTDMVMAFSRNNPYQNVNFLDFYVCWKPRHDPAADPEHGDRDGFGGDLFKYNWWTDGFDPITGAIKPLVPAREYMKLQMAHWLLHYRVDGLRLDSVNNVANYDFLQEFKDLARQLWAERGGHSDNFLVVGEELSVPLSLVQQNRLDGLWNETFKCVVRRVILGQSANPGESFEHSVQKLIDCRLLGFRDGTEAINYLTSHDVGGYGNERLYNYLVNNGIADVERRFKLAFVCLLTAVGIPMILAGDEFADEHDLDISDEHSDHKQVDPVNYNRMDEDWRRRIFDYVARLVRFRTTFAALAVNDTAFIHADFTEGKRVLVWQRGQGDRLAVIVANFSDYGTPDSSSSTAEYVIARFPNTPLGMQWQEITQDRQVPDEWAGREPIFAWEAKVYATVNLP
ncbi:alpha amylase [Oculatella sp. LEGE 06141]|uniref:alpha-amylase family glycosyl hydrolase n=1 Tax=Oculatella sp. LEGE 06141 TaxID=1828648 RepID=UPI001880A25B|nr:alpha-amylase family glycosyl hydrolase [Oculatella sp. LEGE 06141]MBE9178240.1 alpha amylase [Oculatella sp. LEGE 06141]